MGQHILHPSLKKQICSKCCIAPTFYRRYSIFKQTKSFTMTSMIYSIFMPLQTIKLLAIMQMKIWRIQVSPMYTHADAIWRIRVSPIYTHADAIWHIRVSPIHTHRPKEHVLKQLFSHRREKKSTRTARTLEKTMSQYYSIVSWNSNKISWKNTH